MGKFQADIKNNDFFRGGVSESINTAAYLCVRSTGSTALLMEDGCNFLDSKQWTIKALIQDMLTGRVAMEKIAQKVVKFAF